MIVVKKATTNDIPILLDYMMQLQQFEHKLSERARADEKTKAFFKDYLKRIGDPSYVFLVAWNETHTVGIATGWKEHVSNAYKNEFVGFVCQVIVDPAFRGNGVGKQLFEAIKTEFKSMGVRELKAEVLHNNPESIRFWKSVGFEDFIVQLRMDV